MDYDKRPVDVPETIDFAATKIWIDRCKSTHGKICDQLDLPLRYSNPIDIILVDVEQDCITMKTTSSVYFALSYVWGGAVNITTTSHNVLAFQQPGSLRNNLTLPKTVADAMLLTQKMGVRYLWVDCLSIIQDSSQKHQDIANMDIIYSQAELTIAAIDSKHADSGLPGVRPGTRRRRVTSQQRGRNTVTLHMQYGKYELLRGTIYGSRGWTFQEQILSRRILFITERQAVFHCGVSQYSESLPKEKPYIDSQFGFGDIDLQSEKSFEHDSEEILGCYSTMVQEYSTKRLSFEADIENAFSGLASILEKWCRSCPVVHGLMSAYFGYSMLWTIGEDQEYYSAYSMAETGKQRKGFPSWSWVGWTLYTSIFCRIRAAKFPLNSLIRNIEITNFNTKSVPSSFVVMDRSVRESSISSIGQQIQIRLESAPCYGNPLSVGTLGFDAERTSWGAFTVKNSICLGPIFKFYLQGNPSGCGFLSIVPDPAIICQVYKQATTENSETDWDWSLVRLYQLQLQPKEHNLRDGLQELLRETEISKAPKPTEQFRRRLQKSKLLYILLIRRRGIYWERMGSGLMFERYWPSSSPRAKVRAHQERIVMI
jgi:hypothetical protein